MIIPEKLLSNEEYHAYPAITSGRVRHFKSEPHTWKDKYVYKTHPDCIADRDEKKPHLILGQAVEDYLSLNHSQYLKKYITIPDNAPRKPTQKQRDAKKPSDSTIHSIEFWDEFEFNRNNKIVLTGDQSTAIRCIAENFNKNKEAYELWDACSYQDTYRTTFKGHEIQCRFDAINKDERYGLDMKTTGTPLEKFSKSIKDYRYDLQQVFYSQIFEMVTKQSLKKFSFIVCETIYPFRVQIKPIPEFVVHQATSQVTKTLISLIDAINNDNFPETPAKEEVEFSYWDLREMGIEMPKEKY